MKTAISLPNELFDDAEGLAERLNVSRSELYNRALREYLARHAPDMVTQSLNEVCQATGNEDTDFYSQGSSKNPGTQRVVISQGEVWWADLADPIG